MPSDQRLRLHDDQDVAPLNQSGQPDKRQADRVISSPRPDLPLDVQRHLLAEEQILGRELGARSPHRRGEPNHVCQNAGDGADVQRRTALGHSTRIARGEAAITTGPYSATATNSWPPAQIRRNSLWLEFLRTTGDPRPGDIVILYYPRDPTMLFVKRVIAGEGDVVRSEDGTVFVNDVRVRDDYVREEFRSHDDWGPEVVQEGYYLVMGDHRNSSSDSRAWGQVPKKYIVGRVNARWWPLWDVRLF
jgi:signal peptidase I